MFDIQEISLAICLTCFFLLGNPERTVKRVWSSVNSSPDLMQFSIKSI